MDAVGVLDALGRRAGRGRRPRLGRVGRVARRDARRRTGSRGSARSRSATRPRSSPPAASSRSRRAGTCSSSSPTVAEDWLSRDGWTNFLEWMHDAGRPRAQHRGPLASGAAHRRAQLVPRHGRPGSVRRAAARAPAGHLPDDGRLEQRRLRAHRGADDRVGRARHRPVALRADRRRRPRRPSPPPTSSTPSSSTSSPEPPACRLLRFRSLSDRDTQQTEEWVGVVASARGSA